MTLPDVILLVAAGLVGGAINSLAGGGSLIVFPAFVAIGYPTLAANVTNSVAQWPSYLGGVIGFREQLAGQRARAIRLTMVGMAGAVAGCLVLLSLPSESFDLVVPFLVLAASLLLAVQPRLARLIGAPQAGRRERWATYPVLFASGAYGGYFGGALGVILISVLALIVQDTLRRINALKTVLSTTIGAVTIVLFGLLGPVHWGGVATVAPATLVGGLLGARLARRLDERVLRVCVVVFGVGVSIYLFLRN
ncbi:MAG TPA: sulfite exporter TauE/SafE family protein [Mycobacteriales bacterium]|nr:sulfite exporter TauE/SafE family protein [Mycobacteriales bacterium]